MPRYQLIIEYHGAGFVGWQHQENGLSVQQALEQAIFEFCQQRLRITAAGRTDSGVHARGQSIHFDLTEATGPEVIRDALNYHLRDHGVSVLDARLAADDFDARRSAKARHYLYRIINRRAAPTIDKGLAWHVPRRLDAEAMHAAAQRLVGHHDFTTFRAIRCQARSPVKTLDRLDVERQGDKITIRAEARSFLHHQVRSMVGTLKLVGEGKWTGDDVAHALAARDRTALGLNAPAHGLYLMRVIY